MKPPIRIAVLHFSHETATFLPNDTELADFLYLGSPAAGADMVPYRIRGRQCGDRQPVFG